MTPAQEQAILQAIAYKRTHGETELVVLAPFADEGTELDGVPVYGSLIRAIDKADGSSLDAETGFLILSKDELIRALMAKIGEVLR